MKRMLSFLLVIVMGLSIMSGCSGSSDKATTTSSNTDTSEESTQSSDQQEVTSEDSTSTEPEMQAYTIGVLYNSLGTQEDAMKTYLDGYVAPAFNCKFIYSEACDSAEKAVNFIENSYSSGAQAILSFSTETEIVVSKCNELGLYVVTNGNKITDAIKTMEYNTAFIGASTTGSAQLFADVVEKLVDDGQNHNVIIVSGGAGIGSQQHLDYTIAALNALQEIYGLTYEDDVNNIASATAVTEVNTGTDIKILIYPGYAGKDTYVSQMSSILQSGDYDILLSTYQAYTQFSVAVDEVEKNYGFNIKVASVAPLADTTKKGFNTLDSTGNSSVDAVIVKPNSIIAQMFAIAYNALTGQTDFLKDNGTVDRFEPAMWKVVGADEYNEIANLDQTEETYAYTIEDLKQMIRIFNPALTKEKLNEMITNSTVEDLKEKRGIQ